MLDALEQALHEWRPVHRGGLIHHSDRGCQYVSIKYTERLSEARIEPSVGSVGDSYDTALAETINGLYKSTPPSARNDLWPRVMLSDIGEPELMHSTNRRIKKFFARKIH